MIDYAVDHKLQKNEALVGQYKPHLDKKVNKLMASILKEFNGG